MCWLGVTFFIWRWFSDSLHRNWRPRSHPSIHGRPGVPPCPRWRRPGMHLSTRRVDAYRWSLPAPIACPRISTPKGRASRTMFVRATGRTVHGPTFRWRVGFIEWWWSPASARWRSIGTVVGGSRRRTGITWRNRSVRRPPTRTAIIEIPFERHLRQQLFHFGEHNKLMGHGKYLWKYGHLQVCLRSNEPSLPASLHLSFRRLLLQHKSRPG